MRKHPKPVAHTFKMAQEEKELLVSDGVSKESNYTINEINDSSHTQWCPIYNLKHHNTIDCSLPIHISKPHIKCFKCEKNTL